MGIDHPRAINSSITQLDRYVIYDMKSKRKFGNQLTIDRVVFLPLLKEVSLHLHKLENITEPKSTNWSKPFMDGPEEKK